MDMMYYFYTNANNIKYMFIIEKYDTLSLIHNYLTKILTKYYVTNMKVMLNLFQTLISFNHVMKNIKFSKNDFNEYSKNDFNYYKCINRLLLFSIQRYWFEISDVYTTFTFSNIVHQPLK